MNDLIKDISILTDVSENTLNKFIPVCNYCIGHAVHESECLKSFISEIDLGFGELHIKIDEGEIKYKFIPSNDLEKLLIKTVTQHCSPVISKLESNLQEKIERSYKELL